MIILINNSVIWMSRKRNSRVSGQEFKDLPFNSANNNEMSSYEFLTSCERKGGAYLAKPYSAKPESVVRESDKPYLAKPGNC